MTQQTDTPTQYNWDIAISLCDEDRGFAKRLVKAINPGVRVFFYDDKQEELIAKSGPEVFANVFKNESRLVVILSRAKWGKTFYTKIEQDAILDRYQSSGIDFIMVLPIVPKEIPTWYPSTRIYVRPEDYTVDRLAQFIEFRLTNLGGQVEPLTLETRYQHFLERIEEKEAIIKLQTESDAIKSVVTEVYKLPEVVNTKLEFFKKNTIWRIESQDFTLTDRSAYIACDQFILELKLESVDDVIVDQFVKSTQQFCLKVRLCKLKSKTEFEELESDGRFYYFTQEMLGWAVPEISETPTIPEKRVLFFNPWFGNLFYDLTDVKRTEVLIDEWFQKFFELVSAKTERYL